MGDEGVGIHAVRALEDSGVPDGVTVLDGGTGGFHLLEHFQAHDRVLMIDAALDDGPPGQVTLRRPRFSSEFPRSLSAHDVGLKDLLETANLLGPLPEVALITVSVTMPQPMEIALSPAVAASLPEVLALARRVVREFGAAD